ncbi:MAG TPA: AraC family transcriptional regulator [Pyrinomonadaceae bacterium]|jgi:transcriptional regulator GlxA family with amidase domain
MDPRVQTVMALMESSYQQEWSLESLAEKINLSPSYLCHLFKAETDVSPLHYLKSVRMKKAKELMESTFLNVKQIMHSVGLKDKCHFARDFKRMYGVPPTRFRARLRAPNAEAKFASK